MIEAELCEHRSPIRKSIIHMEALRRITGERDRLARARGLEDNLELDRAHILGLVDEDMLVAEQLLAAADERAGDELMKAKEDGVVLCVEARALFFEIVIELESWPNTIGCFKPRRFAALAALVFGIRILERLTCGKHGGAMPRCIGMSPSELTLRELFDAGKILIDELSIRE